MVDLHVHVALKGFDSVEDTRTCRHSKAEFEASPLLTVACALRRETPIGYPCCSRERL